MKERPIAVVCSLFLIFLVAPSSYGGDIDYESTNELSPNDYLFGSSSHLKDSVFDKYPAADLDVDLGLSTSDCSALDIKNTLKTSLDNILNEKYLESVGMDILKASPMLLISYLSPSWASVLRHSRIRSNFQADLRLGQCRAAQQFVDSRISEYQEERSRCVQKSIKENDGNIEKAMESCKDHYNYDIASWSGDGKTIENRLIESSADWAGFQGKEAERVVDLTKAFIGDTVIKNGNISIDFGSRRLQLTPRTYFNEVRQKTYAKLCGDILKKVSQSEDDFSSVDYTAIESDLNELEGLGAYRVDIQTLESLSYLPLNKRKMACRKLSNAIAYSGYATDMEKVTDFISSKMGSNPHYPTKRKYEVDQKRRIFNDQVELTLAYEKQNITPLNQVLKHINQEGLRYMRIGARREIETEYSSHQFDRINNLALDCGDRVSCN